MNFRIIKSDLLLLLTAVIWGFAFVAQRAGMEYVGPFTYNAFRFALGAVCLLPFQFGLLHTDSGSKPYSAGVTGNLIKGGLIAGVIIFIGASLQQNGLVFEATTAGKAGFITGLYVIIVPAMGLLLRQRTSRGSWIGAIIAVVGLYLLSVRGILTIETGDTLVLAGAFVWAAHVLVIGKYSKLVNPLKLAFIQFIICSILSFISAGIFETIEIQSVIDCTLPILYGGVMSTGIAFTLQVVAQREAPSTHAAIIMSLEAVFAVIGGMLILSETLELRGWIGCALMLVGMIVSGRKSKVGDTCISETK